MKEIIFKTDEIKYDLNAPNKSSLYLNTILSNFCNNLLKDTVIEGDFADELRKKLVNIFLPKYKEEIESLLFQELVISQLLIETGMDKFIPLPSQPYPENN